MASKTMAEARARVVLAHIESGITFHERALESLQSAKEAAERLIEKEREKADKAKVKNPTGHAGYRG